jgi:hypothetical protein
VAEASKDWSQPRTPTLEQSQEVGLEAFYTPFSSGGHFWNETPETGASPGAASQLLRVQGWPLRKRWQRASLPKNVLALNGGVFAMVANVPRPPVPQPFTRVAQSDCPLTRYYQPPHDPAVRRQREMDLLLWLVPWRLASLLNQRFDPTRRPYIWSAPPTRASFARDLYSAEWFNNRQAHRVSSEIIQTAGRIEWLLEAPEEAVGGLNRIYLLLMQKQRLLQLWAEVQRLWPKTYVKTFEQALG